MVSKLSENEGNGNFTAGAKEDARYYLNHPGARNIVSNDSPPFLARARINTIIPGTTSIVYIIADL